MLENRAVQNEKEKGLLSLKKKKKTDNFFFFLVQEDVTVFQRLRRKEYCE